MNHSMRISVLALAALVCCVAVAAASPPRVEGTHCPVFPADNAWNQRVDTLPAAKNSDTLVDSIGANAYGHAAFGSGLYDGAPIGIPYVVVGKHQKRVKVTFEYAD